MIDEFRIVLQPENVLDVELQDQETLGLQLTAPVEYTGTTNYNLLGNKPQINGVTLQGNKTPQELGAVNRGGDTMSGVLVVPNIVSKYGIEFQNTDGTNVGAVCQDMSNNNNQVYVDEYTAAGKRECYLLPAPTATEPTFHEILTSKNAVTIAQGGTGADTANGACENIGAVKKAGDTMTGDLTAPDYIVKGSASGVVPSVMGRNSNGQSLGTIDFLTTGQLQFRSYLVGVGSENYKLPVPTTSGTEYQILTTKDGVLAYQDDTVSIDLAANTWTHMNVTQRNAPTGYTSLTRTIVDGSTTNIRGYLFMLPNNTGNNAHILLYSTQAVSGTFTLRTWFVRTEAIKSL